MSDLSYMDPPIEVAATSPRLEMILQRLRTSGMRPRAAIEPVEFFEPAPLLIDLQSVGRQTIERCARACMMGLKRQLIILDADDTGLALTDAMTLHRDGDLSLLPGKLEAIARRAARAKEVEIRRETAIAMGAPLPNADPDATPDLLYLGNGSPLFLSLQGALKSRGIGVTAALSQRTAEDYLSQRRFAAALVDISANAADASSFIDWVQTGGQLTSLPVIGVIDRVSTLTAEHSSNIAASAEIVAVDGNLPAAIDRIEYLARRCLAEMPPVPDPSLSSKISDLVTGLFSRSFLEAHLVRQMAAAEDRKSPLSLITLKLTSETGPLSPAASRSLSQRLTPLLRETDCAAAFGAGTIVVSLPSTPYRGGVRLAERIAERVARTADLSGLTLSWRVVERRAYHTPKTLLGAGLTGPYSKIEAA